MGAALERLSLYERESIARQLLEGCDDRNETKIGAHCPFHKESTPGGAFWYNAEEDLGYCYGCQQHGDLIDIYAIARGYATDDPEAFRAFWAEYAPEKLRRPGGKSEKSPVGASRPGDGTPCGMSGREEVQEKGSWNAQSIIMPSETWREHATKFVMESVGVLQGDESLKKELYRRWGIRGDTAGRLRIGWNPQEEFRAQRGWGLPDELNSKGRPRCIHLPVGFVFPVFRGDKLLRAKIRLENPGEGDPRYKAIKGGSPNCYGVWGAADARIWVVVETERDGMLLWQELAQYGVGAMAVGTARLTPDAPALTLLAGAELVINALDGDVAGACAAQGHWGDHARFVWERDMKGVIRWPIPSSIGKDAGNIWGSGISAWEWLSSALPDAMVNLCEEHARHVANDVEQF